MLFFGWISLNQRPSSEGIETLEGRLGTKEMESARLNQRPSSEGIETPAIRRAQETSGRNARSQSAP